MLWEGCGPAPWIVQFSIHAPQSTVTSDPPSAGWRSTAREGSASNELFTREACSHSFEWRAAKGKQPCGLLIPAGDQEGASIAVISAVLAPPLQDSCPCKSLVLQEPNPPPGTKSTILELRGEDTRLLCPPSIASERVCWEPSANPPGSDRPRFWGVIGITEDATLRRWLSPGFFRRGFQERAAIRSAGGVGRAVPVTRRDTALAPQRSKSHLTVIVTLRTPWLSPKVPAVSLMLR